MQTRQWYVGVMLVAALAVSGTAGAQQTQKHDQKQGQKQTGTSQAKPAPFNPCTGDGLPPSSQMAPFAPGSPSNIDPKMPKTVKGSITCSNGKCKAVKSNSPYAQPSENAFPLGKSKAAEKKANGVNAPKPSAAEANPFPEAESRAAQAARQKAEDQPPTEQGVYSSSDQRLPSVNALGNGPVVDDSGTAEPSFDPELAKKDDKVGRFYLRSGDWAGAYGRYKEATRVDPQDLQAVIGLAMAADRLGKRDEAIKNYKLYLDVKPNGRESKDALRALKRLAGK